MLNIKTPELYVSEENAIHSLGSHIRKKAARVVIVWSETAKKITYKDAISSLKAQEIQISEYEFEGYPTIKTANYIASLASDKKVDFIIAIGGGRVMDTAKAAGDIVNIPVIAVPTVAATCAAWAALSVMYTEEGNFDHFRVNAHSPYIVIADSNILALAPVRYLKAGIVDTLAKWYETSIGFDEQDCNLSYIHSVNGARLAYDFLLKEANSVIENAKVGIVNANTIRTIDAIIFLAGNVGSYVGDKAYSGFAHPFYHSSRIISETRKTLHGEIVAFGLIVQAVLEGKSEDEVLNIIKQFDQLDVAFTLEDIGLTEAVEDKLTIISKRLEELFPDLDILKGNQDNNTVVDAVHKADCYVRSYKGDYKNG